MVIERMRRWQKGKETPQKFVGICFIKCCRYDVKDKDDIPGIRIFLGDVNKVVTFPKNGDYSLSNLRSFLRDNVDIYIGLPGCLKDFDKIAVGFAKGSNQQEKLKEAEQLKQTLTSEVCFLFILFYGLVFGDLISFFFLG